MNNNTKIDIEILEAPYKLPEGWKWVRLGDCAKTISKGTTPKGGKDAYIENGINYLRIENLMDNGSIDLSNIVHITKEQHEGFLKRSILEAGDLLISIAGTLGRVGFVKESDLPMNTNQAIAFVRLYKDHFDNMYLKYAIESPFVNNELIAKTKVTSIPNLTLEIISNCLIPLPPTLEEQQRIVNRIESMFAKLYKAKEKAQNVVDSFEPRKAAILHQAFTGNLTAKWRKENGISDDSWEEKSIGNCGSVFGGGTPSTSHKEYWENGNIPWITSKDMKFDLIEDSELHVNMNGIDNSSAKYIDKPAVLFVMRSGILRRTFPVCMVKKEFTVNQDLKALVPNDSVIPEYLFYACKSNERKILDTCMKSGTTVESINSDSLFNFLIKIPSLTEQQEIVHILNIILEKERTAKSAAEQVLEQIDLLKKSILARAFRGEL